MGRRGAGQQIRSTRWRRRQTKREQAPGAMEDDAESERVMIEVKMGPCHHHHPHSHQQHHPHSHHHHHQQQQHHHQQQQHDCHEGKHQHAVRWTTDGQRARSSPPASSAPRPQPSPAHQLPFDPTETPAADGRMLREDPAMSMLEGSPPSKSSMLEGASTPMLEGRWTVIDRGGCGCPKARHDGSKVLGHR